MGAGMGVGVGGGMGGAEVGAEGGKGGGGAGVEGTLPEAGLERFTVQLRGREGSGEGGGKVVVRTP